MLRHQVAIALTLALLAIVLALPAAHAATTSCGAHDGPDGKPLYFIVCYTHYATLSDGTKVPLGSLVNLQNQPAFENWLATVHSDWNMPYTFGAQYSPSEGSTASPPRAETQVENVLISQMKKLGVPSNEITVNPGAVSTITAGQLRVTIIRSFAQNAPTATATPTTAPSNDPAPSTAAAGTYNNYLKLIYTKTGWNPAAPKDWQQEIATFVAKQQNEGAKNFFAIVSQNSAEAKTYPISRGLAIEQLIKQYADPSAEVGYDVIPYSGDSTAPAYIFSDIGFNNLKDQKGVFGNIEDTTIFSAADQMLTTGIQKTADTMWTDLKCSATNQQQVSQAIEDIKNRLHIRVIPVYSTTPFPLDNEKALRADITADINNQLCPNARHYTVKDLDQPCTVYLLVDERGTQLSSGGVSLFEHASCGLTPRSDAITSRTVGNEEVALLQNAMRNTKQPNPVTLLAQASAMVEQGQGDLGVKLAQYVAKSWGPDPRLDASAAVVQDERDLIDSRGTLSDTERTAELHKILDSLDKYGLKAMPPLNGRAGALSIEAATELKDCTLVQRYLTVYKDVMTYQDRAQGQTALQLCAQKQLSDTCAPLAGEDKAWHWRIVIINDGLDKDTFTVEARTLANAYYGLLDKIPDHSKDIDFYSASLTSTIATGQGMYKLPQVDYRVLSQARSACHADAAVVLSKASYLPSSYAGVGLISSAFCTYGNDPTDAQTCMLEQLGRDVGATLFHLTTEDNTIMASTSQHQYPYYSYKQQQQIKSVLEGFP